MAVCAHPDDESFGLGAILDAFRVEGARISVICFTRGEASTLHGSDTDLATVRSAEFARAAEVLRVSQSALLGYPDGQLSEQPLHELASHVHEMIRDTEADLLLTFDEGGITGHPDHVQATRAAVNAGSDLRIPVLAWTISDALAKTLRREFEAEFVGRSDDQIDFRVAIDRARQLAAIACHASQSVANPVLVRRLELSGNFELLRWLAGFDSERPGYGRVR